MRDTLRETLRWELKENLGHRVTVIWNCNGSTACSTGTLVELGIDFLEVQGVVPTFADIPEQYYSGCQDLEGTVLDTVIPLDRVCAVMENVPCDRKATLPNCCFALDPQSGPAKR